MANTYIVTNNKFKPYTFEEMLKPYQMYTEAYNKIEDELSNLDIMASDIASKLTDNPEDQELRKLYNEFNTELNNASNELATIGLTPQTRKKLSTLKSKYTEKLNPINEAYKAYAEDKKYLSKMRREHPEIIIEGVGNSISDYMYGNTPNDVSANLNTITESSRLSSAGLSKQFIDSIGLQSADDYVGRYLMYGKTKGLSPDMIKDFTDFIDSGDVLSTEGGKALYNIFEKERASSNYYNMSSDAQKRIDASIVKGLIQGVSYDEDYNYIGDNYWDIETKKQQLELTRAKLKAEQDKINDGSDLDLRTDSTLYRGENYDMSMIADFISNSFEEGPIEYNGEKIYDPIQAYNIIHKNDSRIKELEKRLNLDSLTIRDAVGNKTKYDSWKHGKSVYINGILNEALTNNLREYEQLTAGKKEAYKALEGYALSDKNADRMREYSESSNTGVIKPDELLAFATKLETDFTAGQYNEEAVTIFSHTNSEKGLEDAVGSISKNITTRKEAGVELNITTPDGKHVKPKEIEKLLDENGKIDVDKIQSLDIDFRAAQTGTVKMITTSGKVYYVDATYLGTQANNFIKGSNGIYSQYAQIMQEDITGATKAEKLNRSLASAAKSIQSQFDLNRNQAQSGTISNTDLFGG